MTEEDRLPLLLGRLGIGPRDVDAIVLGHLHFDHAGGLADFTGAELHCHADEWDAARENGDGAYFASDFAGDHRWRLDREERALCAGLSLVSTPGHTAGHQVLLHRSALFSGDHLWWEPEAGRLGASRRVCWHSWAEQRRSMERLLAWPFEWVLPGHGARHHAPAGEMRGRLEELVRRM